MRARGFGKRVLGLLPHGREQRSRRRTGIWNEPRPIRNDRDSAAGRKISGRAYCVRRSVRQPDACRLEIEDARGRADAEMRRLDRSRQSHREGPLPAGPSGPGAGLKNTKQKFETEEAAEFGGLSPWGKLLQHLHGLDGEGAIVGGGLHLYMMTLMRGERIGIGDRVDLAIRVADEDKFRALGDMFLVIALLVPFRCPFRIADPPF